MASLIGEFVEVTFLDHTLEKGGGGSGQPMKIRARGVVRKITKNALVLCHWDVVDKDKEIKRANDELARILISTILEIDIYRKLPKGPSDYQ